MAIFMFKSRRAVTVKATRITYEDKFFVAWWNDECVAVFNTSEVIGCWLDWVEVKCNA
jgi:hypothetical protein